MPQLPFARLFRRDDSLQSYNHLQSRDENLSRADEHASIQAQANLATGLSEIVWGGATSCRQIFYFKVTRFKRWLRTHLR